MVHHRPQAIPVKGIQAYDSKKGRNMFIEVTGSRVP